MIRLLAVIALALAGCGNPPSDRVSPDPGPDSEEASYSDFLSAFTSGADCPDLFRVRNDITQTTQTLMK